MKLISHITACIAFLSDVLITSGETLQVQLQPQPTFDNSSQSWALTLTCGNFQYTSNPPFDVVWTTPAGQRSPSSSYEAGTFRLLLPVPVEGGTYTCQLPDSASAHTCVTDCREASAHTCLTDCREASAHTCVTDCSEASAHTCVTDCREASVTVDQTTARLSLLEARNRQLEVKLMALADDNSRMKGVQVALASENSQLRTDLQRLQGLNLPEQINDLRDTLTRQVSFLARPVSNLGPFFFNGTKLIFRQVLTNQGKAYNATSGDFVAPYSGTYFFAVSTKCWDAGETGNAQILASSYGDTFLCRIESGAYYDDGSCQAVVHLAQGDRVWIHSYSGPLCYVAEASTFSGFLVSADV